MYFFSFWIEKLLESNKRIGNFMLVVVNIVLMILIVFCELILNCVNVLVFFNFKIFIIRICVEMFFIRFVIFVKLLMLFFIECIFWGDNFFFFVGIRFVYFECCYFKLLEVKKCLRLKFINIFCVWLDKSICVR